MMFDEKKLGGQIIHTNYDMACVEACKKVLEAIKANDPKLLAMAYEDLHVIIDAKLDSQESDEQEY